VPVPSIATAAGAAFTIGITSVFPAPCAPAETDSKLMDSIPASTETAWPFFIAADLLGLRQKPHWVTPPLMQCVMIGGRSQRSPQGPVHSATPSAAGKKITKQQDDDHERKHQQHDVPASP
jgi:hypothetical protein